MYIRRSDQKQETAFLTDLAGIPVLTRAALKSHRSELYQDGCFGSREAG